MRNALLAGMATFCCALVAAPAAMAEKPGDSAQLRKALTVPGVRAHQKALQAIADRYGGTRASGLPGYDASGAYVIRRLKAAGYKVTKQDFTFPYFEVRSASLARTAPTARTYVDGTDFAVMEYSGSGSLTGAVVVPTSDVVIPPGAEPSSSNSGCEGADFPAPPADPAVALVQRGTCTFLVKAQNAQAAGYDGVIIFNEGQPGREDLLAGTLGETTVTIPVVGTTFAIGEELYQLATAAGGTPPSVDLAVDAFSEERETFNVLADTPAGNPDQVVIVGAHLDSVVEGPGINDNGSGVATILEIARQMSKLKVKPRNKVRFAFWGAEESGLIGSTYYVDNLTPEEQAKIALNLNFDMVGSPNFVRFVYDGDGSETPLAGPPGSAQIEQVFLDYFASKKLETEPTAFDGRSDYGSFIAVGIPAGGLFSGAEGIKTPEEAAIYGGTAGIAYDPCYHLACDTYENNSNRSLSQLGDAAAHATYYYAMAKVPPRAAAQVAAAVSASRVSLADLPYRGGRLQR